MKHILTGICVIMSLSAWAQTGVQTLGNKNNTVRANGKLDADSGTYSKGMITLTCADSSYFINIINTHAGTGSVTGKGKVNRIVVLTDTSTIASSNLVDSANYFTILDTAIFKGKVQLPNLQVETIPGDSTLVVTPNNFIRKTPPYAHVIKVSYPTPVFSTSGHNDTLVLTPPTTIAGYGITDVYTQSQLNTSGAGGQVHFNNITNKPVSLSGYGSTGTGLATVSNTLIADTAFTATKSYVGLNYLKIADTGTMLNNYSRGASFAVPGIFNAFTIANSSHILTGTLSLANQSARTMLMGPSIGSATSTPAFRLAAPQDIQNNMSTLSISGGTITYDLNATREAQVTLTSNATLAFTNLPTGNETVRCRLVIYQDGTGGRTLLYPSGSYVQWGLASPYLGSSANSRSEWVITYDAAITTYTINSSTY